jgi:glycosyltransferase involved in cell wall biosynthesis
MTLSDIPGGNTEGKSSVSIIIPVYNEKATVREVLGRVAEAPMNGLGREIIIVDDFSKDGTREILKFGVGGIRFFTQE